MLSSVSKSVQILLPQTNHPYLYQILYNALLVSRFVQLVLPREVNRLELTISSLKYNELNSSVQTLCYFKNYNGNDFLNTNRLRHLVTPCQKTNNNLL